MLPLCYGFVLFLLFFTIFFILNLLNAERMSVAPAYRTLSQIYLSVYDALLDNMRANGKLLTLFSSYLPRGF